jgi:hypothetical protein
MREKQGMRDSLIKGIHFVELRGGLLHFFDKTTVKEPQI